MKRTLAGGAAGIAALLLLLLVALVPSALADGNETLGPPSVAVADGTGVATGGTGLGGLDLTSPGAGTGTIDVAVPAGTTVKQVLLYWEGHHTAGAADNTINVAGHDVTGDVIGTAFFVRTSTGSPTGEARDIFTTAFRADITGLGVVAPGDNSLAISGVAFDFANNGAGVTVIFDDGGEEAVIGLRDGADVAHSRFPEPRQTTVPQTFTFPAHPVTRTAQLDLHVASVAADRPNAIKLTVGNDVTMIVNELGDTSGPEWDTISVPVVVPAGVGSVTAELVSLEDDSGRLPASLVWVAASFSIEACPPASDIPQKTRGRAYGADATVLGLNAIRKLGDVKSQAPGSPQASSSRVAQVNVSGLAKIGLVTNRSNSTLTPFPTTTASSTIASVELLGGLVKTGVIRAVSQSTASLQGASFNSNGSTIADLRINGAPVADVKPGAKFIVNNPLGGTLAEVHVYEETGSSTAANGQAKASHSVNMLRVVLLQGFLGLPTGAEIIVGHAESSAQSPLSLCPIPGTVSGEAFTAFVTASLLGGTLADLKVGSAVLPPTGGSDSDGAVVNVPGVVTSKTAHNTTSGSLTPHPNATSRSRVEGLNVLNGLITAKLLDVTSTSHADGTTAGTTFTTRLVDLKIGGVSVNANAAPNTTITVPLPGVGSIVVVVNEQILNTDGMTSTDGTVNALHVYVFALNGLLTGEVIVASAHSDAHTGAPPNSAGPGDPPAPPNVLPLPDIPGLIAVPVALVDKFVPPVVKTALATVNPVKKAVLVKVPLVLKKAQLGLRVRVRVLSGKKVVAVRALKVTKRKTLVPVKLVPGKVYRVQVLVGKGKKAKVVQTLVRKGKKVKKLTPTKTVRVKVVATPKAKVKAKAVLV